MSENKIAIGFMAVLETPTGYLHTEGWDDANERIEDEGIPLQINYEGSLIYNHAVNVEAYQFDFMLGIPKGQEEFIKLCEASGFSVKPESVQPYFSHWYNGGDCPMSLYTLAEFTGK